MSSKKAANVLLVKFRLLVSIQTLAVVALIANAAITLSEPTWSRVEVYEAGIDGVQIALKTVYILGCVGFAIIFRAPKLPTQPVTAPGANKAGDRTDSARVSSNMRGGGVVGFSALKSGRFASPQ